MNGRARSAEQILDRVRGAMVPTEADAARNFAGIEARLGLLSSGAPPANTESAVGSTWRPDNGPPNVAPKVLLQGARATRHALTLAAHLGGLAAFGFATGLVGYLLGRAQPIPPAALVPPAIVAASSGVPRAADPSTAPSLAPLSDTPQLAPSPDALRGEVSAPSSGTALDEAPTRSEKLAARGEGATQRSRARTASRAVLHRAASLAASAASAAPVNQALSLGEALELLRRAESAVRNSDGLEAKMWLGDLDRRAPREMLREERLATAVLAHCVLGDVAAARTALAELEQTNSASLYRARLETSCAGLPTTP